MTTLTQFYDQPAKWARAYREDGGICFLHALDKCYGPESYGPLAEVAVRQLGLGARYEIVGWNDSPERTFDEVIQLAAIVDEAAAKRGINPIPYAQPT